MNKRKLRFNGVDVLLILLALAAAFILFKVFILNEVVSRTEGKITMLVTIEADVVETDRAFLANGCDIRVGKQFSLMLPEIYGVGFCIRLDKE